MPVASSIKQTAFRAQWALKSRPKRRAHFAYLTSPSCPVSPEEAYVQAGELIKMGLWEKADELHQLQAHPRISEAFDRETPEGFMWFLINRTTALLRQKGSLQLLGLLIDAGVSPNARECTLIDKAHPLLSIAASSNAVEHMQLLLDRGADPNAPNEKGAPSLSTVMTVLRSAFENGKPVLRDMVHRLLRHGANPNIPTVEEHNKVPPAHTPLADALAYGEHDLAESFLQAGADVSRVHPHTGKSVLQEAVCAAARLPDKDRQKFIQSFPDYAKNFAAKGCDLSVQCNEGSSLLLDALMGQFPQVVASLVAPPLSADWNAHDIERHGPFAYALVGYLTVEQAREILPLMPEHLWLQESLNGETALDNARRVRAHGGSGAPEAAQWVAYLEGQALDQIPSSPARARPRPRI